jgi:2'-5' RNA ligase
VELSRKSLLNVGGHTVIAYWLIPAEPARSFFKGIITDLARRYDAPLFGPHVTIHVGKNRADLAETALADAAREAKPIRLKPAGIDQSGEFVKTLFVQIKLSAELRQMSEIIRNAAHDSSQYELKPHLSLLYKNLAAETRRELAASITLPFSEIIFDSIQAVRCVSPTQTSADVELWRLIAATPFSG